MHLGAWACQDEKSVFLVARLNVISWSRDLFKVGDAIAARMSATICYKIPRLLVVFPVCGLGFCDHIL